MSAQRGWLAAALLHETDDCLIYPFRLERNGYGRIALNKVRIGAHAFICERAHGPKPTPQHEAAHSCGRRACCNKRHLRWATSVENNREKIKHGTVARGEGVGNSRWTEETVLAVKAATGLLREIAVRFGVPLSTVHHIRSGRTWRWLR